MPITQQEMINLAVTLFNAAPDADNLKKMQGWVDAHPSATIDDLTEVLSELPEFKAQFENKALEEKSLQMLEHFSLSKGTSGGDLAYNYFLEHLREGEDEATLLKSAYEYLEEHDELELKEYGLDVAKSALSNKYQVAEYFAIQKSLKANSFDDLKAVLENISDDDLTVLEKESEIESLFSQGYYEEYKEILEDVLEDNREDLEDALEDYENNDYDISDYTEQITITGYSETSQTDGLVYT